MVGLLTASEGRCWQVEGRELLTYPEGIVGPGKRIPEMCVVSLGKHDGVSSRMLLSGS